MVGGRSLWPSRPKSDRPYDGVIKGPARDERSEEPKQAGPFITMIVNESFFSESFYKRRREVSEANRPVLRT